MYVWVTLTRRMCLCVGAQSVKQIRITLIEKKTRRWCLQGSLRKEFMGKLRTNLPPSCARPPIEETILVCQLLQSNGAQQTTVYAVLCTQNRHTYMLAQAPCTNGIWASLYVGSSGPLASLYPNYLEAQVTLKYLWVVQFPHGGCTRPIRTHAS